MATYYLSMVMGSTDGYFGFSNLIPVGPEPIQIEKADFNKDGYLDLAILSIGTSAAQAWEYRQSLHVLAGDGLGRFRTPFMIALSTTVRESRFAVGDFDGDGWPDLALLESPAGRVRLALNRRSADIRAFMETATPWPAEGAILVAPGDFDGDGRDDLALAARTMPGGDVFLLLAGETGSALRTPSVGIPFPPTCMAAARIDGDGAPDLALGGGSPSMACAIRGDGAGGLGPIATQVLLDVPSDVAVGNLDGRGCRDLVGVTPQTGCLVSLLVTESGPPVPRFVRGDSNGDGEVDIVDAVVALIDLFLGGASDCMDSLDANDDRAVDIADPVFVLRFLFQGGPAPPPPFPVPGVSGEEGLGCERLS